MFVLKCKYKDGYVDDCVDYTDDEKTIKRWLAEAMQETNNEIVEWWYDEVDEIDTSYIHNTVEYHQFMKNLNIK